MFSEILEEKNYLTLNAKLLAWGIFLIFFIENGTLGLIPKQFYLQEHARQRFPFIRINGLLALQRKGVPLPVFKPGNAYTQAFASVFPVPVCRQLYAL